MMFGLAKTFRAVSKNFTLCNNLVIRPNTIEFKILHRKYIELVSKLTTRGPKWNFVTALYDITVNVYMWIEIHNSYVTSEVPRLVICPTSPATHRSP